MGFPGSAILVSAEKATCGLVAVLPTPVANANFAYSPMRAMLWGEATSVTVRLWHICGVSEVEQAAKEIEAYITVDGWNGPVRVFSLVDAEAAMAANSTLAAELPADATGLLSIEQEELPSSDPIDELLGRLARPDAIDGAVISFKHVTFPPEAEAEILDDAEGARRFVAADPCREDIGVVVGVLRNGKS